MPLVDISQAAVQSAASRAAVIDGASDGQRGLKNQRPPAKQPNYTVHVANNISFMRYKFPNKSSTS